ncbi:transposase [Litorilinea aerophila]|uniref:Transposase IS200-like domain-containing protein n=1 Tax=Litorilinea aerophila TaxID=1204385 RepID=A0A540VEP6_9CHLR|nr:transposase [Litorilinea aerophila]MCC9076969.1 transposase [Litorilinea aerophila]GIV76823.1 MAG: transposase [Litorilinea sp.]
MADYRRYLPDETLFVTCRTFRREPVLADGTAVHLLRTVLNGIKQRWPFLTVGYVILPDHFHWLMKPQPPATVHRIVAAVQQRFARDYQQLLGMPEPVLVWQTGYQLCQVRGEEQQRLHLDYIHYDPVRHGQVARPEEWAHSSYAIWVERGLYRLGWGWTPPDGLAGLGPRE